MPLHLVIANKRYSSWSMRPWLVLAHSEIPFTETLVPLDQPDTRAKILALSPSGRVPCLIDGAVKIWDSLAIIEYLAERFPDRAIWPHDVAARALARSISAEMHAGFPALRSAYPMNLRRTYPRKPRGGEAAANDIARILEIWRTTRAAFGAEGPFLFGTFSAADAYYAPVVTRLETYDVPLDAETAAYVAAIRALPAVQAWRDAAALEPWIVTPFEAAE